MANISMRISTVFDGNGGWEHEGYTYRLAVGVQTIEAPNGDLISGWMTGGDRQPADDHVYICSRSTDRGYTWSRPQILAGGPEGNGSGSLFRVGDRLFAMCAIWEDTYNVWHYTRRESRDNGVTWGDPVPVTLYEGDGLSSSFGNMIRTSAGELLGCGTYMQKRPQPLCAGAEQLAHARTIEEALALPPAESEENNLRDRAIFQTGIFCFDATEDMTGFTVRGSVGNRPLGLSEPSLLELEPGHLVMLCRADWGGFLWRSDSYDGGHTWCDAYQTDIPNPGSPAQLLRLPDGRIALFHNHGGGAVGRSFSRDRLAVWISEDGMRSWSEQEDIIVGGYLTHPVPLLLQDGSVAFSYDKNQRWAEYVQLDIR